MLVEQVTKVLNHPMRQHFLNLVEASLTGIKLHPLQLVGLSIRSLFSS